MRLRSTLAVLATCSLLAAGCGSDSGNGQLPGIAATPTPSPTSSVVVTPVREGTWGGAEIVLQVKSDETIIQLDCAHGTIPGRLTVDENGQFKVSGTITYEGGPDPSSGRPAHPALYSGTVVNDKMQLSIQDLDANTTTDFTLIFGSGGSLHRCL